MGQGDVGGRGQSGTSSFKNCCRAVRPLGRRRGMRSRPGRGAAARCVQSLPPGTFGTARFSDPQRPNRSSLTDDHRPGAHDDRHQWQEVGVGLVGHAVDLSRRLRSLHWRFHIERQPRTRPPRSALSS